MILNRESLLAPRELNTKEVSIEGLGLVRIRQLNHSAVNDWKKYRVKNEETAELKLITLCLVGGDDRTLLTELDIPKIANQPATTIALLIYETMVVNGFMRDVGPEEALSFFKTSPDRLFMCRLAGKFGVSNVDVFADSLTSEQLQEWKAVALLDGWFDSEDWINSISVLDKGLKPAEPALKPGFVSPTAAMELLRNRAK